jgi:hypothetical protein
MPITLAGSARRRVVERDTGTGAVAGSADGSGEGWRAVGRDTGAGGVAGSAHGSTVVADRRGCAAPVDGLVGAAGRGDVACGVDSAVAGSAHGSTEGWRAVGRDTGAGGVAGSAHGSTVVAGRPGCAAAADGLVGAAGRGDVACGVDSAVAGSADGIDRVVGALGCAASLPGAGAAGGVAFTRAARAGGLFESKGGGSVGFLTWSEDAGESAGPAVFAGGEIGSPLCA